MPDYRMLRLKKNVVSESVKSKLIDFKRKLDENKALNKLRDGYNKRNRFHSDKLSHKEFTEFKMLYELIKNDIPYPVYKVAFNKICKKMGIPSDGTALHEFIFKEGKNGVNNSVTITYYMTKKQFVIPNGTTLYHKSPKANIKELKPVFKGRLGWFYDKPRVYFSMTKNISNLGAGLFGTKKVHVYTPKENISVGYSDPENISASQALYVTTNLPIAVTEISKKSNTINTDDIKSKEKDIVEFVTENDIILCDDELYDESVLGKLGEMTRKIKNDSVIKKTWNKANSKIIHGVGKKEMTPEEYQKFLDTWEKLSTTESYPVYKKLFNQICKDFGLIGQDPVIARHRVKKDKATGMITVKLDYDSEKKRIVIPNGKTLIHKSPLKGFRNLKPSFRSKTRGKFLYPRKRVYFSIGKPMPDTKMGTEGEQSFQYTPSRPIKTAYIDPTWKNYSTGACYIDSESPIAVRPVNSNDVEKAKKETNTSNDESVKESVSSVDVINYMNTIVTNAFYEGVITEPEYVLFVDLLNK